MQRVFKYIIITLMGYIVCNLIKNTLKENQEEQNYKQNEKPIDNRKIRKKEKTNPNVDENHEMNINEIESNKMKKIAAKIWKIIAIIIIAIFFLMLFMGADFSITVQYRGLISIIFITYLITATIFFGLFVIYENKIKSKIIQFIAWSCAFSIVVFGLPFVLWLSVASMVVVKS